VRRGDSDWWKQKSDLFKRLYINKQKTLIIGEMQIKQGVNTQYPLLILHPNLRCSMHGGDNDPLRIVSNDSMMD